MASRIEAGVTIEGSVRGEGELVVAGRIRGVLTLDGTLVVEVGGCVEAEVEAGSVVVGGVVTGSLVAHDELRILPGGVVDARVRAARLAVADGAVFRGELQSAVDRVMPATLAATGRPKHAVGAGAPVPALTGGAPAMKSRGAEAPPLTVPPSRPATVRKGQWFAAPDAMPKESAQAPAKPKVDRSAAPPRMPRLPRGRTTFGARGET